MLLLATGSPSNTGTLELEEPRILLTGSPLFCNSCSPSQGDIFFLSSSEGRSFLACDSSASMEREREREREIHLLRELRFQHLLKAVVDQLYSHSALHPEEGAHARPS